MTWKTAWITGASSGIGLELATLLDGEVSHVAISARSKGKLDNIAKTSRTIDAYALDVTDAKAVAATVWKIEKAAGPIDLAVLNAGLWHPMDSDKLDIKRIRDALDVNYMGVVNCIDALVPGMLKRGSGHIAIIASVAGYRGLPISVAYGPTKAALINLAETLHVELAPHGIFVSVVNPGFIDTPMTRENKFPMPGIIPAEEAARHLLKGLKTRKFEIIFPRTFVYTMKLLRIIPNALFLWIIRTIVLPGNRKSR